MRSSGPSEGNQSTLAGVDPVTSPSPSSGLTAEGLTKIFGSTVALSGMSATFRRGTVHGLIGENGSGKSTFVKIVAGIHRADEGLVSFDGATVADSSGVARTARTAVR